MRDFFTKGISQEIIKPLTIKYDPTINTYNDLTYETKYIFKNTLVFDFNPLFCNLTT